MDKFLYNRAYYQQHKSEHLKNCREYYKQHRESEIERSTKYNKEHKESHARACKKYYEKNKEKILKYQYEWRRKRINILDPSESTNHMIVTTTKHLSKLDQHLQ